MGRMRRPQNGHRISARCAPKCRLPALPTYDLKYTMYLSTYRGASGAPLGSREGAPMTATDIPTGDCCATSSVWAAVRPRERGETI